MEYEEELIVKKGRTPDPLKNAIAGELVHNQGRLHSSRLLARVWNDAPGGRGLMFNISCYSCGLWRWNDAQVAFPVDET